MQVYTDCSVAPSHKNYMAFCIHTVDLYEMFRIVEACWPHIYCA